MESNGEPDRQQLGSTPLLNSASANRFSSCSICLQADNSTLIVFGAGSQIAVWDCQAPPRFAALVLLSGHGATVSVIKKLSTDLVNTVGFLSGDINGGVLAWKLDVADLKQRRLDQWKIVARLTGHQKSISSLSSAQLTASQNLQESAFNEHYILVAGASDGRLISWKLSIATSAGVEPLVETVQIIEMGNRIVLDASLAVLPGEANCHTDWVRCLDFAIDPLHPFDLLLASGSQDNYIRIWRCTLNDAITKPPALINQDVNLLVQDPFTALDHLTQELKDAGRLIGPTDVSDPGSRQQAVEMKRYQIKNTGWSIASDAVLYGHEGWVTNVHWCLASNGHLQLLSSSSDRSMIMWSPSEEFNGIWLNTERFGEIGPSTNLGFFGAHYFKGPEDTSETILASGWSGGWHRWTRCNSHSWEPQVAPTGHHGSVTGLEWDGKAEYLLSCSSDQTTRLWGRWRRSHRNDTLETWHELGRPQVHGHDLYGITFIGDRRTSFASISEEKVIRAFEITEDFCQLTKELWVTDAPFEAPAQSRAPRATLPPLGLSNRTTGPTTGQDQTTENNFNQRCPPYEDQLLANTLWPETDKIYGHPSELSSLAASHTRKLIASACHANSEGTACIRLHSTTDGFRPVQGGVLEAHQLTVTRLVFNEDDSKLVSVSRDRSWSVWKSVPGSDGRFELDERLEKAHTRIIWDACWAPLSLNLFATASRDRFVKLWARAHHETVWKLSQSIKFDQPVRSCAMTNGHPTAKIMFAIGLEDGKIELYGFQALDRWEPIQSINLSCMYHSGPVNCLAFAPHMHSKSSLEPTHSTHVKLASGGLDGSVKVTKLDYY